MTSFEPLEVWARHATVLLSRLELFERVRRETGAALISVRHTTPQGEDTLVGTFAEISELLRQSNHADVAAALERARRAPVRRVRAVAIIHDLLYPATLVEVPS